MSDRPTGAELIAAERRRQVEQEGWTPEHDDEHDDGQLISAAREYASTALKQVSLRFVEVDAKAPTAAWPWHLDWWNPSDDPVRNLAKAGALIAAEIDRLQRAGGSPR